MEEEHFVAAANAAADSDRSMLLLKQIQSLMDGYNTFRRAYHGRRLEAELRAPLDNLLRLVWQRLSLEETDYM